MLTFQLLFKNKLLQYGDYYLFVVFIPFLTNNSFLSIFLLKSVEQLLETSVSRREIFELQTDGSLNITHGHNSAGTSIAIECF